MRMLSHAAQSDRSDVRGWEAPNGAAEQDIGVTRHHEKVKPECRRSRQTCHGARQIIVFRIRDLGNSRVFAERLKRRR